MNPRRVLPLACALASLSLACPAVAPSRPARVEATSLRAPDEVVVDLRADGEALVGRVHPVPPQSDADRVLSLRWLTASGPRAWRFADTPAVEARFVPGASSLVVITREHALVRLDAPGAEAVVLDRGVYGPLSLDALGRYVVYTRGEAPMLEVVRVELATGRAEALAPGLVPAWCPALSPDGREVVTVASPEGTPGFYRLREGEAPSPWRLPPDTPLPTGPTAPVVFGDALVYESDGALHALGFDGALRRTLPGVGLPVHVAGTATLSAQDAQRRVMRLTVRELGVTP